MNIFVTCHSPCYIPLSYHPQSSAKMSTMLEREFADIRERLQQTEVQLHQERKARKQLEKMVGAQNNIYCVL